MNKLEEFIINSYDKKTMDAIWHQGYIDTCYMSYNKASELYNEFKDEIDQANYERHNELGDSYGNTGEYLEFYVASAIEYLARYLVEVIE